MGLIVILRQTKFYICTPHPRAPPPPVNGTITACTAQCSHSPPRKKTQFRPKKTQKTPVFFLAKTLFKAKNSPQKPKNSPKNRLSSTQNAFFPFRAELTTGGGVDPPSRQGLANDDRRGQNLITHFLRLLLLFHKKNLRQKSFLAILAKKTQISSFFTKKTPVVLKKPQFSMKKPQNPSRSRKTPDLVKKPQEWERCYQRHSQG